LNITSCADFQNENVAEVQLEGTYLADLADDCRLGYINSSEDFAEKLEELKNPTPQLTVEEQIAEMANQICSGANHNADVDQEIKDACLEDPRDDEAVLDATVRVEFEKNDETELLPGLNQACVDIDKNRDAIYASLEVLKEKSSGRRHLQEGGQITSCTY
jgi:hypothetical protein